MIIVEVPIRISVLSPNRFETKPLTKRPSVIPITKMDAKPAAIFALIPFASTRKLLSQSVDVVSRAL